MMKKKNFNILSKNILLLCATTFDVAGWLWLDSTKRYIDDNETWRNFHQQRASFAMSVRKEKETAQGFQLLLFFFSFQ